MARLSVSETIQAVHGSEEQVLHAVPEAERSLDALEAARDRASIVVELILAGRDEHRPDPDEHRHDQKDAQRMGKAPLGCLGLRLWRWRCGRVQWSLDAPAVSRRRGGRAVLARSSR